MSCWDCCIRLLKRCLPRNDIVVELAPYLNTANGGYANNAQTNTGGRGQTNTTNTHTSLASRFTNSQGELQHGATGGGGAHHAGEQSRSGRRRDRHAAAADIQSGGADPSLGNGRGKGSILNPALLSSSTTKFYSHNVHSTDDMHDNDDLGSTSPMNGRGDPYIASTGGLSHVLHKYAVSRHQADPRCREVYHPLPHTASGHTLLPVDVVMGHDVIMQGGGMGGQNTPMLRACDSTSSIDINVDDFDSSTVFVYVSVAAFQRLARQFQELMEEATSLYVHMIRSRLNEYGGVELRFNEGYFVVGFQTEFNAARWCLAMQLGLMYAAWNPRFLRAPEAQEEMSRHRPMPVFRGLRVRMAIHSACPNSESDDDDVDADSLLEFTEANPPEQDPRELVRLIGECVHGGQIALSDGVWEKMKEQLVQLGNPVVEDLGKHVVGGHALQLFQLLPKHLEDRHFLPLMSIKQLAPAMRDAPTAAGEVTMVFTFIEGARSLMLNDAHALVSRVKTICTLSRKLLRTHRGYECQELQGDFMLAFFRPADAIAWCGEVQKKVHALFSQDPSGIQFRISMGIETGVPVSVSPHKSSGRADYFGNIVNQTARIAKAAHGGQIMLGGDAWKAFMHDSASHSDRPLAGSLPFYFKDHGYFQFKGIASGTLLVEVVPFGLETIVHAATTAKVYKKPVPPSTVPLPDRNRLVYVWSQTGEGESDVGYSIRDTEVFDDKSLYGTLSEWTPQDLRTWFNEDSKRGVFDMPHAVCELRDE
ncbi:hypothetical protein H310_02191 [Aphanomyces invadans]|uniref:Guanylate cyclase domain-containing protein n=1 Tax=Aphanomyces invadans TaxID=157072 RepID=A0A024UN65_9STRA|nr:hypothetical protein H310_02191 [Aphanomyces invadans]ETW07749.1 hypothetical protein H310_02191 [Aphanomyces invadans]|eukprot:XP_008863842.1 hypothetical protein H310_02191 [Aphanomyces invadans]